MRILLFSLFLLSACSNTLGLSALETVGTGIAAPDLQTAGALSYILNDGHDFEPKSSGYLKDNNPMENIYGN